MQLDACNHGFVSSLTLRNLDEPMLHWLRAEAASHRRSLNSEVLDLLRIAQVDALAAAHRDNPFAQTLIKARKRGVRTSSTAREVVRRGRDVR